jgi:hypothetical protein
MAVRFYNPGFKISELLRFDHPTNDVKVQNLISYYRVEAEPKAFFDVPTETEVETEQGPMPVAVRFADRIQKEYKAQGVVRVNPKAKDVHESENVALTEKEAKEKGEHLWRESLKALVDEHDATCAQARANGMRPRAATGNTKYALKVLGFDDPANDADTVLNRKQDTGETEALKAQLAALQNTVNQLIGAKAAK